MGLETSSERLSKGQKEMLQNQWMAIKEDAEFGKCVFADYLKANPDERKYFTFLRNANDVDSDPVLLLHGLRIMKQLRRYFEQIDDPRHTLQVLTDQAKFHMKFKIPLESYMQLKKSFKCMLKQRGHLSSSDLHLWEVACMELIQFMVNYEP